MKLKLDENIGLRGLELMRASGHDVRTVREQELSGATDDELFQACAAEGRALITLDHDFGYMLRFPPEQGRGIAIIEVGGNQVLETLLRRLRDLLKLLDTESIAGALWVVEPGRVRIRRPGENG